VSERFIEVNPDVEGGEPVIRGTRIPVRRLARRIEAGESREVLRAESDYIDPEAFDVALRWARDNPRPARPGMPTADGPEPAPSSIAREPPRRPNATTVSRV
jgi:uncharacterized protein (DUF433 family)